MWGRMAVRGVLRPRAEQCAWGGSGREMKQRMCVRDFWGTAKHLSVRTLAGDGTPSGRTLKETSPNRDSHLGKASRKKDRWGWQRPTNYTHRLKAIGV